MAPTAMSTTTATERRPSVAERHNVNDFGGRDDPPAVSVFQQLHEEPEVRQLFSLSNSSIIVTGGARGLGLTMAAACVESGADVLCCDVLPSPSFPEWTAMQEKSKRYHANVEYLQLDIVDAASVEQSFEAYRQRARYPVKGVVHAAGVMDEQLALDYDMNAFQRVMRINVDGTMNVAKAGARAMRAGEQTGGSIILIASISGQITNRGITTTAYSSSKAACLQMARSLAVEWGPYDIRVNTISPGYIRSAMTNSLLENNKPLLRRWEDSNPLNRIGNPSDLKGPAVFLLSQASNFVTGTDFRIDGGHCAW